MNTSEHVDYTITFSDQRVLHASTDTSSRGALPIWTELAPYACADCPLKSADVSHCPAALAIVDVVEAAATVRSIERVFVEVKSATRTVTKSTDAQEALSALVGLRMARSGCPRMAALGEVARFHIPFCSPQETLVRVAGHMALGAMQAGHSAAQWRAALVELYRFLAQLNRAFAQRLRTRFAGDVNVNAFVRLFSLSAVVEDEIDASLGPIDATHTANRGTT